MEHIVYVDSAAEEMQALLSGAKTMIIRGATGRKLPYGRVQPDDVLYFINNNAEGLVKASAVVKNVLNSEKLTKEESNRLIAQHQTQLRLTPKQMKRWSGKRYLVLIEVENVTELAAFPIDKSDYGNMDDWLPVGNIESVRA